jgi:energy-coupling factor transporter ATP-binding protein EcfA2
MITEPRILLLDEPIGALDYSLRETVMLELKLLQQRTGISFIWVTHDQNEAFSLGDLVVVMNHARSSSRARRRRSCSAGDRLRRELRAGQQRLPRQAWCSADGCSRSRRRPAASSCPASAPRSAARCRSRCAPSSHRLGRTSISTG